MDFIPFKRYVNNVTSIITNPRKRSSYFFFFLVYRSQPQAWTRFLYFLHFAPSREKFCLQMSFIHPYNKRIFIGTFILRLNSDCASVHTKVVPHSTPVHEQINKRSKDLLRNARYVQQKRLHSNFSFFTFDYRGKKKGRKWIFEIINNLFVMLNESMALSWLRWFRFITSLVIIGAQACVVASSA